MKKGQIGKNIKGSRIAKGISTNEMAEVVGVTPQRINAIERELDEGNTLIRILIYLQSKGVDLNLLFK